MQTQLEHLRQVLELLQTNQLFVKFSKCAFGVMQVAYLGHLISQQGVAPDPDKLSAIVVGPLRYSITTLCVFLGLVAYYRRFICHFTVIANPVNDLLKKNSTTTLQHFRHWSLLWHPCLYWDFPISLRHLMLWLTLLQWP